MAEARGIILPEPPQPVGAYQATLHVGGLLFVSGQLPIMEGGMAYSGRVGQELTVEQGEQAARLCALNLLSQLHHALQERQLETIARIDGLVCAGHDFHDHAQVVNGASELLAEVLGDRAGHVRTAVGCSSLPMGAAVEIAAIAVSN